jgi:hypothetical protein
MSSQRTRYSYQETRAALRTTHRAGVAEGVARDTIGFRVAMAAEDARVAVDPGTAGEGHELIENETAKVTPSTSDSRD